MSGEKRSRRFAITWNNPRDGIGEYLQNLYEKCMKYMIVGFEQAPETGTRHLQIYCEYKHGKTLKAVRKDFCDVCHVECAKGSGKQNEEYCQKGGTFKVYGKLEKQGCRNDLHSIRDDIEDGGGGIRGLVQSGKINSYQGLRMAENLMKYCEPKRKDAPKVIWRWGDPGCGKSRWIYDNFDDPFVPVSYKWWEGYDGHETVLIDDIRGNWCTWSEFLKLIDRYPFRVECKGGSRQLLAKNIVITAPFPPCDIWKTIENKSQLYRRITEVHRCWFDNDYLWELDETDYGASIAYA